MVSNTSHAVRRYVIEVEVVDTHRATVTHMKVTSMIGHHNISLAQLSLVASHQTSAPNGNDFR